MEADVVAFLGGWFDTVRNQEFKGVEEKMSDTLPRNRLIASLSYMGIDPSTSIESIVSTLSRSLPSTDTEHKEVFQMLINDWTKYKRVICEPLQYSLTSRIGSRGIQTYFDMVQGVTLYNCFDNMFWNANSVHSLQSNFPSMSSFPPLESREESERKRMTRKRYKSDTESGETSSANYAGMLWQAGCARVDYLFIEYISSILHTMHAKVVNLISDSKRAIDTRIKSHKVSVPEHESMLLDKIRRMHNEWIATLENIKGSDEDVKRDFIDTLMLMSEEKKEEKEGVERVVNEGSISWESQPLLAGITNDLLHFTSSVKGVINTALDSRCVTSVAIKTAQRYSQFPDFKEAINWVDAKEAKQQAAVTRNTSILSSRTNPIQRTIRIQFEQAIQKDINTHIKSVSQHLLRMCEEREKKRKENKSTTERRNSLFSRLSSRKSSSRVPELSLADECKTVITSLSVVTDHPNIDIVSAAVDRLNTRVKAGANTQAQALYTDMDDVSAAIEIWVKETATARDVAGKEHRERERYMKTARPKWADLKAEKKEMKSLQTKVIQDVRPIWDSERTLHSLLPEAGVLVLDESQYTLPRTIHSLIPLLDSWICVLRAMELCDD
jgi:hypothetical protein